MPTKSKISSVAPGVLVLFLCASLQAEDRAPGSLKLPSVFDYSQADAAMDALQIWRLGSGYFENARFRHRKEDEPEVVENPDGTITIKGSFGGRDRRPFTELDSRAADFLETVYFKPAVQFSCARTPHPYEDALEKALSEGDMDQRLLALALLMKARAPASVAMQFKTWISLSEMSDKTSWKFVLEVLGKAFDPAPILRAIETEPDCGKYSSPKPPFLWSVRAAGAAECKAAIPRLQALSVVDNLATNLAAERSLEEFSGGATDGALVFCLLGWRYNAYIRAGNALLKRNPALLRSVLEQVTAPEDATYQQGLLLAACDSPKAVPLLCSTVKRYQIIDGKMFEEIARLAGPEHRELVENLPSTVRPNQMTKAKKALETYRERMEGEKGK